MPSRHTFFSFHYGRDIWRANVVRNSGVVIGHAAAGFKDKSLWEATKRRGEASIRKLIRDGLMGTSVTCVLIGARTSSRPYVRYEIDKSLERGNGVFGVYIHGIRGRTGLTDVKGPVPRALLEAKCPVYTWTGRSADFARWVEEAYARRSR